MQVLPSAPLASLVKHYLFLEINGNCLHNLRLFPDGNAGIVLCEEGKLFINNSNQNHLKNLPSAFLYGKVENFQDILCHGPLKLVIIVLKPYATYQFLNGTSNMVLVNLADVFGNAASSLLQQTKETRSIHEKIKILEHFLTKSLFNIFYSIPSIVPATITHIIEKRGMLTVNQLVKFTGYEKRQLERIFLQSTGLSPKRFTNMTKLHFFLKDIRKSSEKTKLNQLAYGAGYYDQSHLIRDFKKITGLTPTFYFKHVDKLAVNFLQL